MKQYNIGDLVRTTKLARKSLEHPPIGFGCITKVNSAKIVYVTWYKNGSTQPINTLWLEVINEST